MDHEVTPGVSDYELIDHLREVVADVATPVCIVSRRKIPLLNSHVTELLKANVGGDSGPKPVTADRFKDLPEWINDQDGPVAIISYLSLWRRDASHAALAALAEVVPVGSRFVFVEPTLGLGFSSLIQRVARPLLKRRLGVSFHRDIPAVLRSAGWQLTTVKRVSVGAPAAVMTFAVGEARKYPAGRGANL